MKECSACSAAIPESATTCSHCGHQAIADPIAVPPRPQAPIGAAPAPPARRAGLGQRELVAGAATIAAMGLLTLLFFTSRGTPEQVAAAGAPAPASAPAAEVPPSPIDGVKWSAANVAHWTGRARNSAAFELHAENTVAVWTRHVRPLLVVRCMAKSTEAFVITDSALKIEPDTDDHTVTFSFDGEPETKERWLDSDDHNAVFSPDATAFTQRLARARTLHVGYTPHNADPVTAVFHVNGLGPLIEPSAKHCGWTK